MSPYISGFLIFLIIALYLGAFLCLLKNKSLNLNEESLDKQPLFWFAVLSPIVLFLIFGVIIWKDYIPDLSKAGLENFAKISTFPLAVLTLSPILGVIVSNIHKSIQTEKQIEQSEIKGRIDSFIAHYKFIMDRIDEIQESNIGDAEKKEENNLFHKSNPIIVYKSAFPKSTLKNGYNGEPVSQSYIKKINTRIEALTKIGLISLDEIIKLKEKKNENSRMKNIEKIIFTKERKKEFIHLMVGIGLDKNKENYIDFYDENGQIKNEKKIIGEYGNIYTKLHYHIFLLLKVLNVDNAKEIAQPCMDTSNEIIEVLRQYSKLESMNKEN